MNTLLIRGPRGSFEVCANSGQMITPYSQIPAEYRIYSSANVEEFQRWIASTGVDVEGGIPILCIGLAQYNGRYTAPEEVYREEWVYHTVNTNQAIAA